jgi:hypothetical protein
MQITAAIQGHHQAAMATTQITDHPVIPDFQHKNWRTLNYSKQVEQQQSIQNKQIPRTDQELRGSDHDCYNGSLQV